VRSGSKPCAQPDRGSEAPTALSDRRPRRGWEVIP